MNWFNDLAKHIFDLKMMKEKLQKELKSCVKKNDVMLSQMDTLRFDRGEYHEQMLENKIISNKQRTAKLVKSQQLI